MENYLSKIDMVSAACRLTLAEETSCSTSARRIFSGAQNNDSQKVGAARLRPLILNRRELVKALMATGARSLMRQSSKLDGGEGSAMRSVRILYSNAQGLADFMASVGSDSDDRTSYKMIASTLASIAQGGGSVAAAAGSAVRAVR